MEKYLVPLKGPPTGSRSSSSSSNGRRRGADGGGGGWKRTSIEINGRVDPQYRHHLSSTFLMNSYSQIGGFPHLYHLNGGVPCPTHINCIHSLATVDLSTPSVTKQGISSLQFDSKGIYLVSVTKSGCLTVHDFETLYCHINDPSPCSETDESMYVLHLPLHQQLDAVGWNLCNQDEVACASMRSNEVKIFNISYISAEPVEVLRARPTATIHGSNINKGLCDIAFTTIDESRLIASDTNGVVNVWDRRTSILPCLELATNHRSTINRVQLNVENQLIFGAGRHGVIFMWDLRGGRTSSAFQSHKEVCNLPVASWKLASMLEKIGSLKAQSDIVSKEVHSIDFDPSCPHQLAFHLDDGWSGVFNIYNFEVTHVHCPPPAWLDGSNISANLLSLRKPSWLPACSIYMIGSSLDNGIHLLDFYPDPSSPCHVHYREDVEMHSVTNKKSKQNRFVPLSDGVTACAAHPINGTIIAGTKDSSLLMVSQKKRSA